MNPRLMEFRLMEEVLENTETIEVIREEFIFFLPFPVSSSRARSP